MSDPGGTATARARSALVGRLGGFLGLPMLSALAPFIILPVISRISPEGWGAFNAAQAIGTVGGILALFGWGMFGPPAIAQSPERTVRQRLYHDSLVVRSLALGAVLPVCLVITWFVVDSEWRLDSLLMAGTFTATAMLPGWYFIGLGKPMLMARYDIIPRFVATVLAIPLLLATGQIWPYPVLTLAAIVGCTYLFSRRELRGFDAGAQPRRSLATRLRQSAAAAGVDTASNAYGSVPVPIATASLSPAEGGAFGSVDRLYRVGVTVVVGALGNAVQAWVLDTAANNSRRRQWLAIYAHVIVGVVGFGVLAGLGPWVTGLVFGERVAAQLAPSVWYGVAFFFISVASPLIRNLLIPVGQGRLVFVATLASSVVGLATMAVGAVREDATVIAVGLAVSQALLVALLVRPALTRMPAR